MGESRVREEGEKQLATTAAGTTTTGTIGPSAHIKGSAEMDITHKTLHEESK